jgi:hypothetical protein
MTQIIRARIGRGIPLQDPTKGEGHLHFSNCSAATPAEPISVENAPVTDTIVSSTASSAEAALMRLGFSKAAATSALPWLSLLGEGGPEKSFPSIHVVARQIHAQITVNADIDDLNPHPSFVLEVQQVLSMPADVQLQALRKVLRRWGSLIATTITLGCAVVSSTVFLVPCHLPVVWMFWCV